MWVSARFADTHERCSNDLDTSDEAMAPTHTAYEATSEDEAQAWAALIDIQPTTLSGALAFARNAQNYVPANDGLIPGSTSEDALRAVAEGLAAVSGETEDGGDLTVASAASLQFQGYTFDAPLRSPREWGGRFGSHAIAMHIADKTLRMTKPELMAFVRSAGERADGTDGVLMDALNAATASLEGWVKLLHLAST
jgi:hypothetical protein